MQKEAEAKAGNGAQNGFGNPAMNPAFIAASIDQMVAQMDNPNDGGNMEAQFAQITSMFNSDEVQEAVANVLAEIKKDRKEKADAEAVNLKALIQQAGAQILKAKKPEDLDDMIAQLQKSQGNRYGGGGITPGNQALYQQVAGALEFTKQWQDYLSHLATGQTELATRDLQSLSQNNNVSILIPRSKLLELEAPGKMPAPITSTSTAPAAPSPVQVIFDDMKTLDDVEPAMQRLAPLRPGNGEAQNAYNMLSQLLNDYHNLKAGLPAQFNVNNSFGNGPTIPAPIRTQFLLLTLQARFGSYKGPPPAPTEKPADFVSQVIADATSREDWALLQNAVQARSYLQQSPGLGYSVINSGGLTSLVAASHQEIAGQYALAVASYEMALKSDDPDIPAKAIGDKLAAIQRDHPKEYADGMQMTFSPPSPRVYQRPSPFSPGNVPPAVPTTPIPPTLLSPAATTNTVPATK
jgi:hypothetical protein